MRRLLDFVAIGLLAASLGGCTKNRLVDFAMSSAPRLPRERQTVGAYQVLAGDLHCHVQPPDAEYHVSRTVPDTVRLATEEGLDFVVLTPHVPSRFYLDPITREWVRGTQAVLRAKIEPFATTNDVILIPGMEYTDFRYGHVGLSFADVREVLDAVSVAELERRPESFFEAWQAHGGLATINHPLLAPIPGAPIAELHYDLSWRGFARPGSEQGADVPAEIHWLTRHADAVETWNESIGHVRDRWFFGDAAWELRQGMHLVDRLARAQERRIAPVGGSDSHGAWLRPTTWVVASERSAGAIRSAIVNGRTCVRGPEACTLEVRGADGAFHPIGASLTSRPSLTSVPTHTVEARARGGEATYFVNGVVAGVARDGETVRIAVPGRCAAVRAQVNDSWSASVYVDCDGITTRTLP